MTVSEQPLIRMFNGDCMEAMSQMEDNAYELAIVDPPYGIGCDQTINIKNKKRGFSGNKLHAKKGWDNSPPDPRYFTLLKRTSLNQIIWGGNYFTEYLQPVKGWVFWDKKESKNQGSNFSDGELAWTSIKSPTRYYKYGWIGVDYCNKQENKIHPTQKPVALYKWLLQNYATEGDRILDTHGGSGSIAIACYDMGFDLDWYELDEDYYKAAVERFNNHKSQGQLFRPTKENNSAPTQSSLGF